MGERSLNALLVLAIALLAGQGALQAVETSIRKSCAMTKMDTNCTTGNQATSSHTRHQPKNASPESWYNASKRHSVLINVAVLAITAALAMQQDKTSLAGAARSIFKFFLFPGPTICNPVAEMLSEACREQSHCYDSDEDSLDVQEL